jgi:hypothetical protein
LLFNVNAPCLMNCHFCSVAGIANKELNRYLVFNKILATCRLTPTLEEYRTVIDSFEDFFKIMEEKGHIPEEDFDVCGIRSDKDINGNDVLRTAGISQESLQHSKCLTHSHQVGMRLEHLQIIMSKEIKKKETANMKHAELVDANKNVVLLICEKLQQEGIIGENEDVDEQHMPLCTNKIFSELTNPQLEAFILAHDTNIMSKSRLPVKGKLKDAKDDTLKNRIRLAFNCRMMPNKIEAVLPFDLSDEQPYNDEAEKYRVHQITLTDDETVLPSKLLSDSLWVKYVISFLDLEMTAAATSNVSASNKEKADLLLIKLREQFKSHVKARVKQSLKQNHWVLKFAYKNLPVVAVAMLLSNHLKIELKFLTKMHVCWGTIQTSSFLVLHFQGGREHTCIMMSTGKYL